MGFGNESIQKAGAHLWIEEDSTLYFSDTQGRLASKCSNQQFAGIADPQKKVGGLPWSEVEKPSTSVLDFSPTRAAAHLPQAVGSGGPAREQRPFMHTGRVPISPGGPTSRLVPTPGIGAFRYPTAPTTRWSSWILELVPRTEFKRWWPDPA